MGNYYQDLSAINSATNAALQTGQIILGQQNFEEQMQHNKDMAAITQDYTKENMKNAASYNNQLAAQANARNKKLYEETQSTQAKIREFESAGLSVGLLNGAPSQGGATAASTPSVSNPSGATVAPATKPAVELSGLLDVLHNAVKNGLDLDKLSLEKDKEFNEVFLKQIEGSIKNFEFADKEIEQIIKHSHWKDGEGKVTSLMELAKNSENFEEFTKKINYDDTDENLKKALESELGRQKLQEIWIASKTIDNEILGMEFDESNWKFQSSIMQALEKMDFANLSAEATVRELQASIDTSELTSQQKKAWNDTLNKIKNDDLRNGVIILGMLVNQMASHWKMPKFSKGKDKGDKE